MKLVLKIILLILILAASAFFGGVMIYLLTLENVRFEYSMLIIIGISILGFLSSWFHIKTIKHYRLDTKNEILPKPSKLFWTLNIGSAASLILLSAWLLFLVLQSFGAMSVRWSEDIVLLSLLIGPFTLGGLMLFESYYLRGLLRKNKDKELILEIDQIMGNKDDEN